MKPRYLLSALAIEASLLGTWTWLEARGLLRAFDLSPQQERAARILEVARPGPAPEVTEPDTLPPPKERRELPPPILQALLLKAPEDPPLLHEETPPWLPPEPAWEPLPSSWLDRPSPSDPEPDRTREAPPEAREAAPKTPTAIPGLNPMPRYPVRAIELGQEGRVTFRLEIDREGRVLRVHELERSCSRLLARAARKALERWRFLNGPGFFEKTVEFHLLDRSIH